MNSQVSVEANRQGGQTEFKKSYGNAGDEEEVFTKHNAFGNRYAAVNAALYKHS